MKEFEVLHPLVQKWVFTQGWRDLRPIQKRAISPILSKTSDLLISASTAAGKTEAFFLPACSTIASQVDGFGILYISPLKALINDQHRRLEDLCEILEIGLTPWHGDSSQSKKRQVEKDPSGVLLITPESLESLLIRKMNWAKYAFSQLQYIVIDEFHAFIGTERGQQLLSLLNRLEHLVGRYNNPIPRIALSATLGDIETVPLLLRPNQSLPCEIITDSESHAVIQVQVRGYLDSSIVVHNQIYKDQAIEGSEIVEEKTSALHKIQEDIYRLCRGDSHLVFANSRARTEELAAKLKDQCERNLVPNEFFPHHGSLSKYFREMLESRLHKEYLPTTAICTMTLELGIDIGKVNSVIQVTSPFSVSSLRQRLGRSGRRGNPSILRIMIPENELTDKSGIQDELRLELLHSIAMIHLLIKDRWFEPADISAYHFSTLLHQILALIAQYGGVRADQLYTILCKTGGPFQNVSSKDFAKLLTHLGKLDLITQLNSGELTLGLNGEKLVGHYTFYAVFSTPEEYRIIAQSKTLGSIPIDFPLVPDQHIIFGGQYWQVKDIDADKKAIYVQATKGGSPPKFSGKGLNVHDRIRQTIFRIFCEEDHRICVGSNRLGFLDKTAQTLFGEGLDTFKRYDLQNQSVIQKDNNVVILMWLGDKAVHTLTIMLIKNGFKADNYLGVIEVEATTVKEIEKVFKELLSLEITEIDLAKYVPNRELEKFDSYIPDELLLKEYGKRMFDVLKVYQWINKIMFQRFISR